MRLQAVWLHVHTIHRCHALQQNNRSPELKKNGHSSFIFPFFINSGGGRPAPGAARQAPKTPPNLKNNQKLTTPSKNVQKPLKTKNIKHKTEPFL